MAFDAETLRVGGRDKTEATGLMGALLTDSGRVNGTVPGWPIRGPHGLRRGARLAGISQSARRRSLFGDSSLAVRVTIGSSWVAPAPVCTVAPNHANGTTRLA